MKHAGGTIYDGGKVNHAITRAKWRKKKGREKRLATVASEGSLFVFWLVYTMLLIKSSVKRVCD